MIKISSGVKVAGRVNSFNHAVVTGPDYSLPLVATNTQNMFDVMPTSDNSVYVVAERNRTSNVLGNTAIPSVYKLNSNGNLDTVFYNNILNTVFGIESNYAYNYLGQPISITSQSNGQILAFGVRLNTDGTQDTSFNPGSPNSVNGSWNARRVTAIQSDGKIILGGAFTTYSGSAPSAGIIRFQTNGNIDTTFKAGGGITSSVYADPPSLCIKIRNDGKIVMVGIFNFYSGSVKDYSGSIVLNANGDIDTGFNPSGSFTGSIARNARLVDYPTCVEVEPNNKMTFFGYFTLYQSQSCGGVIKLNSIGAVDPTFKSGSFTAFSAINDTVREANGKIIVVGNFTSYSGSTANRIVRILPSGSIDPDFKTGLGFNNTVTSVRLDSSGNVYCVGLFSSYSGSQLASYDGIIKLNSSGAIDTTFNPIGVRYNTFFTPTSTDLWNIRQIITASLGGYYVIGNFNRVGNDNSSYQGLVKLNSDLSVSSSLIYSGAFSFGTPLAVVQQSDRKLVFGGTFTSYKGLNTNRIIRANEDLSIDTSFKTGSGFNNSVLSLAIDSSTQKIYAGGRFTSYSGSTVSRFVRINTDGTVDTTYSSSLGTSFNGDVYNVVTQTDGKVLVGGTFSTFNGNASEGIVRLNSDGTYDTTFKTNGGVSSGGEIYSIVSQSDGKIVLTGIFTTYSGSNYSQDIVRVDSSGAIDPSFSSGTGLTGSAQTPVILSTIQNNDGSYLIGYSSKNRTTTLYYSGSAISNISQIIKIESNGSLNTSFNCPIYGEITEYDRNYISSFVKDTDGGVIIGGSFSLVSQSLQYNVAKIDPNTGWVWRRDILY